MALGDVQRWLGELMAYHVGEQQRLQRAVAAKGYGLNPLEFSRSYPGSVQTTNLQQVTAPAKAQEPPMQSNGFARKALMGGALAVTLASGIVGYQALARPRADPAPQPAPVLQEQEYEVQWQVDPKTGEMKVSPPKRLK